MSKVRDIMTADPVSVGARTSITEVARRMRDEDLGAVLVVDQDRVTGLVTDRDIVVRTVADGVDPDNTTVADACSEVLVTVAPDDDASRAVNLMREHSVRRLPVLEDEHPVGILSIGDLAIERDEKSALADISAAEPNR